MIKELLEKFRRAGKTISVAESCTGGLLAAALTEPAGASDVLLCGFVTYSNAAKIAMLDVHPSTLRDFGAVSEETAVEMANGARVRGDSDVSISITGIAGPGPSDHKPEGRVCFGVSAEGFSHTEVVDFGALGRKQVRERSVKHALSLLDVALTNA